jgi:hypothetical protein
MEKSMENGMTARRKTVPADSVRVKGGQQYRNNYGRGHGSSEEKKMFSPKAVMLIDRRQVTKAIVLLAVLLLCAASAPLFTPLSPSLGRVQSDVGRALQHFRGNDSSLPHFGMRIDGADPCNSAQSLTAFLRQERFVSSKKFSSDNPVCPSAAHNRMHVAIPMYNLDESTLKEAITSVKTQNYPREKVTVWLYDDGSTRHDSMQTLHNTCDEVFYFAVPSDSIADDEGSWESVYVALDQMGLSNVRNNPQGGLGVCCASGLIITLAPEAVNTGSCG